MGNGTNSSVGNAGTHSLMHYFKWAIIVTVLGLALGAALGWQMTGTVGGTLTIFFICAVLAVLEISLSFDNAIVNAIVVMGHSLGLAVVAEGVETREQAMALESFGCDIQQGYLHGRPMSPEAFAERLAVGQLTILEEWMGEFSYRAADHHGPHHPLAGVQGEGGQDPAGRPTAP